MARRRKIVIERDECGTYIPIKATHKIRLIDIAFVIYEMDVARDTHKVLGAVQFMLEKRFLLPLSPRRRDPFKFYKNLNEQRKKDSIAEAKRLFPELTPQKFITRSDLSLD